MTGPSGSGDIGAVTVHPAQSSMTLTVIFAPRSNRRLILESYILNLRPNKRFGNQIFWCGPSAEGAMAKLSFIPEMD